MFSPGWLPTPVPRARDHGLLPRRRARPRVLRVALGRVSSPEGEAGRPSSAPDRGRRIGRRSRRTADVGRTQGVRAPIGSHPGLHRRGPARTASRPGTRGSRLHWPSGRGSTAQPGVPQAGFDRAAQELGLEGLVPHELRHTAASLAVSSGANVKAVQRMLGHASAAMTLDTYADLFDEVAERLDLAARMVRERSADYL